MIRGMKRAFCFIEKKTFYHEDYHLDNFVILDYFKNHVSILVWTFSYEGSGYFWVLWSSGNTLSRLLVIVWFSNSKLILSLSLFNPLHVGKLKIHQDFCTGLAFPNFTKQTVHFLYLLFPTFSFNYLRIDLASFFLLTKV